MGRQTAISSSLALDKTPLMITIPASGPIRTRKLRVAAYARVSSNSDDQLHSFAAQYAYYTELIISNPEWEFVDVYPSLKLNRTSYMIGGSRKGKRGMFFRVFLCGFLYQGEYAGKEQL